MTIASERNFGQGEVVGFMQRNHNNLAISEQIKNSEELIDVLQGQGFCGTVFFSLDVEYLCYSILQ